MLGLVSLFTDFSSEMINPLLPVFLAGLVPVGWAPVYLGLTEGVAEATASLLKLMSGRLSDRWRRRKALVLFGYGLSALARPALALVASGGQVVGLKFLDRVGKGIRTAPRDALISDAVGPAVRGRAFGFHRAMDHTGAVLGPVVAAGVLLALLGPGLWQSGGTVPTATVMAALRWVFAAALVPGLLAVGIILWRVRELVPPTGDVTSEDHGAARLPGRFWGFVAVVTLFTLGNSSDLFLILYAQTKFRMSLLGVIGMWIVLHCSKIIFSLAGGHWADRRGRRPAIVTGWLVYAVVYLGFAGAATIGQFWALFVAYGVYAGLCEGTEKALVADFVASDRRATAYGVYHAAVGMAALPASLLFGVFWAVIGPGWAFGIGAGLAGLAAGLLLVLPSGRNALPRFGSTRMLG
ncbi:MFS transporter [bacterium]|nr:MFS transporter [bacterium]